MALTFDQIKTAQSAPGFNLAQAAQAATIGSPTYVPPNPTVPAPAESLSQSTNFPSTGQTSSPTPFVGSLMDSQKYFQDLYNKQTTELEAARKEREDFKKILGDSYAQLDTMPDFYRQTEEKLGIPKQYEDFNQINLQIAEATAAFNKQYENINTKGVTSGVPQIFISGEQAALQRNAAVSLGNLGIVQAAMADNLNLAEQRLEKTVSLKYEQTENKIKRTLDFIDMNYQDMTAAEKRQADTLKSNLAFQQQVIEEQKNKEKQIQTLAIEAAANGADANTVANIQKASSFEMAINMASPYLQKTDTQIIEVNNRKVLIDTKTGNIIKDLGAAPSTGTKTTQTERLLADQQSVITSTSSKLDEERRLSTDGYANPNTYRKAKQDYIAAGGSAANFFQSFPLEVYISPPNRKGDLIGTSAEIKQTEEGSEKNELQSLLERSNDGKDINKLNLQEKTRLLELLGG